MSEPWEIELNGHIELLHFANGTFEEYIPYLAAKQMIAALHERIAELERQTQWQPVSEDVLIHANAYIAGVFMSPWKICRKVR